MVEWRGCTAATKRERLTGFSDCEVTTLMHAVGRAACMLVCFWTMKALELVGIKYE